MFFILNDFEESHVKTFCLTRTLSWYTRAPWLVGPKRSPIEGMALGSPAIEAKSADGNVAEQGYVKPHQTHGAIRIPSEQGQSWTCREKFMRRLKPTNKDKLERPESTACGPYLFPPNQRQHLASTCSWSGSQARFPTMNHRGRQ